MLLLRQLEHAEHLVAVDDGRPDGRPLAPELHGLEPGGGSVHLVVGVGDQDLTLFYDALEARGVGEAVRLSHPVDVVLVGDAGPERLGAQEVARGYVLVDAALGAVQRLGDLLRQLDQGVAEQSVLARTSVVHKRKRLARFDVVHGLHPLAGRGIGGQTYGLNGTFS